MLCRVFTSAVIHYEDSHSMYEWLAILRKGSCTPEVITCR